MQLLDGFQIGALCIVAQTVVQQVVHHQTDGVDRALGHGGMAALAPAPDTHPIAFRLQRDVGGIFQLGDVSLYQCAGAVGDCIVGNAALKLLDLTVADRLTSSAPKWPFSPLHTGNSASGVKQNTGAG